MDNKKEPEYAAGICTQCGASLTLDPSLETGTCPYCGTPYVTNRTIVHSSTTNNVVIRNSSDTINIQYGKKGLAQSFFDYAEKRAEHREKAEAAAFEQARIQEEQAKAKRKNARKKVGQFFLWLYFFPVMLLVTIIKRVLAKKEVSLPIGSVVVGAVVWLLVLFSLSGAGGQKTVVQESSAASETLIDQAKPTASAEVNWYDQDPVIIQGAVYSVPTVTETTGPFRYEIPQTWRKQAEEGSIWTYYFPYADTTKTFFMLQLEKSPNGLSAEDLNDETIFNELVEGFVFGLKQSEEIGDLKIIPCKINDMRAALVSAGYSSKDTDTLGSIYSVLLPHEDYILSFSVLMADADKNISMEDFKAAICSIAVMETP